MPAPAQQPARCAQFEPGQALSRSTCDWPTTPYGGTIEPGVYEAAVTFKGSAYASAGECGLGPNEQRAKLRLVLARDPRVTGSTLQAFVFEAVGITQTKSAQRGKLTVDTVARTLRFTSECVDGSEVLAANRDALFIASPRSLLIDSRASIPPGRAPNEGSATMLRFDRVD
ncbi:MAG: hypothetical protein INH41_25950 [Myxococcaceae bacterium]|jgi:hypothetical protein|nr:hypothetical protein [Myxococcaceae bacterium]